MDKIKKIVILRYSFIMFLAIIFIFLAFYNKIGFFYIYIIIFLSIYYTFNFRRSIKRLNSIKFTNRIIFYNFLNIIITEKEIYLFDYNKIIKLEDIKKYYKIGYFNESLIIETKEKKYKIKYESFLTIGKNYNFYNFNETKSKINNTISALDYAINRLKNKNTSI